MHATVVVKKLDLEQRRITQPSFKEIWAEPVTVYDIYTYQQCQVGHAEYAE